MTTIKTEDLKADEVFGGDLTLDEKIVVVPAGAKIPTCVVKRLGEWKITQLYCNADVVKKNATQQAALAASGEKDIAAQKAAVKKSLASDTQSVDISSFL